jgi:hypothetical protein
MYHDISPFFRYKVPHNLKLPYWTNVGMKIGKEKNTLKSQQGEREINDLENNPMIRQIIVKNKNKIK